MAKTQTLGLVRHGETYANIDKVWHGHTDTELTDNGRLQTQKLGTYFHNYMRPDVIYSSPLQRAKNTAKAVAKSFDLPVNLDALLMEFGFGEWEGKTFEVLESEHNISARLTEEGDFSPPDGESLNSVKIRMIEAIEDIIQAHPDNNVLIVSHGVALSIAISHYLNNDVKLWPQYAKSNTAFSELCLTTCSLTRFNQAEHLK